MCQILPYTGYFDYFDQIYPPRVCSVYNHGQKFTKLSKISDFLECFTADLLRFSIPTVKNWPLGSWLGTFHQCQAFEGSFWNFLSF